MDDGNELTVSLKITLTQSVGAMLLDPSPYMDRQYVSPEWVQKKADVVMPITQREYQDE
jgi:hypothetical protein